MQRGGKMAQNRQPREEEPVSASASAMVLVFGFCLFCPGFVFNGAVEIVAGLNLNNTMCYLKDGIYHLFSNLTLWSSINSINHHQSGRRT
jgi:hypothetical protein